MVEFHGDGLLAVFGAPDPQPEKERAAATATREVLAVVEAARRNENGPSVGIGIATGPAFVGDIRADGRRISSVIGNATNLAARLQSMTRELDAAIAIDGRTHLGALEVAGDFERHAETRIRGRSDPVDVHTLPLSDVLPSGTR